jgi:hypothetical protein
VHELKLGGVKLSYHGFTARYDAWIPYDNELVVPTGSFCKARRLSLRRRREEANLRKLKEQEEADAAAEVAEAAEKATASEATEVRVEIMR